MYDINDEPTNWEYKIMRANRGEFARQEYLDAMLRQEARAGWTLVEKYDNHRIRLRRPITARDQDGRLPPGIDPYRTTYSAPQNSPFFFISGCLFIAITLIILLALIATWPG